MNPDCDTITDEVLAQRAAGGDAAAFDALVGRFTRPLLQFIAGRTGCIQDAEDIVQDAFLRAFENIASFDGRYSLKNWLFTIAYRIAVSTWRKKRIVTLSPETLRQMADTPAPSAPAADETSVWHAVRRMKPDDHTVLWLRYQQDLEIEQIAAIMDKSPTGVRVHLHRARRRLAKRLTAGQESTSAVNGYNLTMERANV